MLREIDQFKYFSIPKHYKARTKVPCALHQLDIPNRPTPQINLNRALDRVLN